MFEPTQPARRAVNAQRLSLFDDFAYEKMLWNDEQVDDAELLQIIIEEKEVWIIVSRQSLAFGPKRAIKNLIAKPTLLALEFIFLAARGAEKICDRAVIRKLVLSADCRSLDNRPNLEPNARSTLSRFVNRSHKESELLQSQASWKRSTPPPAPAPAARFSASRPRGRGVDRSRPAGSSRVRGWCRNISRASARPMP